MSLIALQRNNKNQYRKYPLKSSANLVSDTGYSLPYDLIVNCSITSVYGKHRVYVRQIVFKENIISIAIASYFDNSLLGVFKGALTEDYTDLLLTSYVTNVDGNLTIGSLASAQKINQILHFDKDSAELEESVIFCYTPTGIISISDKNNNTLSGDVSTGNLVNIDILNENNIIKLGTKYISDIFNPADKSSYLGNCETPVIKNINSVLPSREGGITNINDGNIYIAGVSPIVFYGTPDTFTYNQSLTISLGAKILSAPLSLNYSPEQIISITNTSNTSQYMSGKILNYDSVTGELEVNILNLNGEGVTASSWRINTTLPGIVTVETEGLNLNNLCNLKQKSLPPVEIYGFTTIGNIDKYYNKSALEAAEASPEDLYYPLARPARLAGNFNSALRPEYYYWPQFVKAEYYEFWPIP